MLKIDKDWVDNFQDWVSADKAAGILGLHRSVIDRNAYAGLYPFRVKDKRAYYYRPGLRGGDIGNPQVLEDKTPTLNRQEQGLVYAFRKKIEAEYDDIILEVVFEKGSFYVCGYYLDDDGKATRLPKEFIMKAKH